MSVEILKLHKKDNAEDMSKYCPVSECSDCTVVFCGKYSQIYEGCTCKDCKEVRTHYKRYIARRKGCTKIN